MDKEKQNRFDCKHLESCMDGCYCKAGHGSIRGYGHCVIPYEQETCKYFERKPKTKTVKITENEVVISKEEYECLQSTINRLRAYDEERDVQLHAKLISKTRKETAKEILKEIIQVKKEVRFRGGIGEVFPHKDLIEKLYELAEKYGVEIGE